MQNTGKPMKPSNDVLASDECPAPVQASLLDAEREAHAGTKARLKLLEQSLLRYAPHELIGILGKESVTDVKLGNHAERFMSVLFADIRDFTALSEAMTPQQTFDMINSYLVSMSPVISAHHGIIDKYIGDAIMALFPDSPDEAVQAAISLLERLDEYNAGRRRAGYRPIRIGIGVNSGLLMLGMIGSQDRMEGTVFSDAVNIAARLESLTKEYGIPLLISEHTLYGLTDPGRLDLRYLGRARVRGKSRAESIYEVYNHDDPAVHQGKLATSSDFDEAIAYYQLKHIDWALPIFERIAQRNPGDSVVKVYLSRCELYLKHQVHDDTGELLSNMNWKEEYRIGISDLDRDHQHLLGKINQLIAAVRNDDGDLDIKEMLIAIAKDVREHFDVEETLMVEHQYPFRAEHMAQHTAYRNNINRLLIDLEIHREKREYLALRMNRLMLEWLVNHTTQVDRHLARYLKERGV
jgi:hemerythrin-like metal-binding protein